MKRVIGYIRVSTDNQDLERQRVLIRKYCENKGYSLLRIEEDYAISGTVSNRNGLNSILNITNSVADMVVVSELSRLSRQDDIFETLTQIHTIIRNVDLVILDEPDKVADSNRNESKNGGKNMAILFDWYENPKTKDKQGEELTLHPRIKLNGSTTTDELRRHIQEYCSLTETDVLAVLDALSHFVGRELGEGRQVHLDGIGYFVPTLTCTEPVTLETKRKSTKVKLKNITFRPDKALRSEIGVLKVKPLKLRNLTKKRLTDDEVKQKVVNYLRKNEFITRSVVQSICGMTRTTATRQIRRLCEENVLVNKGLQKQPIYFLKEKE